MNKFFGYISLKRIILGVIVVFSVSVCCACSKETVDSFKLSESKTLNYEEVKDSLIRFHVIANSDTENDQNLKIKVKNQIISYLYPYLNESDSLLESRNIIKEKMIYVKQIAQKVISENNYSYDVKVQLSRENFPDKSYGDIILPQGDYEAFRVIIGQGKGKNWWCVMFPPLCFVDESKALVEYDKMESKICDSIKRNKEVQSENDKQHDIKKPNIEIKFKIVEVIQELF